MSSTQAAPERCSGAAFCHQPVRRALSAILFVTERVHPDVEPHHGEDFGLYFPRLSRDGWHYVESQDEASDLLWQKKLSGWTLNKWICAGSDREPEQGVHLDRHELRNTKSNEIMNGSDWEWPGFSGKRVVFARQGQLFSIRLWKGGHGKVELLHNFHAMQFQPLAVPY